MSRQRRIRDETDGASVYYNIESDASDKPSGKPTVGAGAPVAGSIFDTARALAANVATKLTGKAAAKLATKALEKGAEKVGEKTGEKLGVLLGEKLNRAYNSRSSRSSTEHPEGVRSEDLRSSEIENRGDLIFKELQHEKPKQAKSKGLIKKPPGETRSISQQFDDLLNLF